MDKENQESRQTLAKEEQTADDKTQDTKWRGGIKFVIHCSIEKAWDLSSDFCGMQRWIATTETCECIEGEPQKPGCVRYATGSSFPRADGGKSWGKEKLLTFDNENRSMRYLMMENSFGFSGYIATYKMQDLGDGAVLVDWSFEVNPIPGSTEQKTADYMTGTYKDVLRKLEELVNSQTSSEASLVASSESDTVHAESA